MIDHHLHHRHNHAKRAIEVVTQYEVVTATIAEVVVYVDEQGNILSQSAFATATEVLPTEESTVELTTSLTKLSAIDSTHIMPTSTSILSIIENPEPTYTTTAEIHIAPPPAYIPTTLVSQPAVAPTAGYTVISIPHVPEAPVKGPQAARFRSFGISYAPYNADSSCKTYDEVDADVKALQKYGFVRSYGTDCNQSFNVLKATKKYGLEAMLGIYDLNAVSAGVKQIVDAVNELGGQWASIHTISVGNEHVNNGQATAGAVADAVRNARTQLRAAGYNGPVVAVDTFNTIIRHPELCQASDYAAANCHAFFSSETTAANAGPYVAEMAQRVSEACGGMNTTITETGWPKQGNPNGAAVPGLDNQKIAIDSLTKHFDGNLILFSAFDDAWKVDNPNTFGCEKFWGIA